MRTRRLTAVTAIAATAAALLAGCSGRSGGGHGPVTADAARPLVAVPVSTSMATAGLSWAVVPTGGPSVGGTVWQLLVRVTADGSWRLATPPGVADNGGLVVAEAGSSAMTVGFVPNQLLRFTPLASSADDGAHWTQGLLPAGLAAAPSALAALSGGRLLAITSRGVQESASGGGQWTTLVTLRTLAATAGGRACGLVALTAAAAGPSGDPLVAGECGRPGVAEVFEQTAGGWRAASARLSGSLARRPVTVLQLTPASGGTSVLLAAGRGAGEAVIPSWLADGATTVTASAPLSIKGDPVTSTFFSSAGGWGAVVGGRQAQFDGAAAALPGTRKAVAALSSRLTSLPGKDATLVFGPGAAAGRVLLTALIPGLDTVAVWQQSAAGTWRRTQVIAIPSAPS